MKQYFRNLWTALTGRNPYQLELYGVREEFEQAQAELARLRESVAALGTAHAQMSKTIVEDAKMNGSLQQLVENLRGRIGEKDSLIQQMREDYRKREQDYESRIACYSQQIASLQNSQKKRPAPKNKFKTEKKA